MKKVITLRVTEEEKFAIEKAAYQEDRSVNNFILWIIKEYMAKK